MGIYKDDTGIYKCRASLLIVGGACILAALALAVWLLVELA